MLLCVLVTSVPVEIRLFCTHFFVDVNVIASALSSCTCTISVNSLFCHRIYVTFLLAHMKPLALTQLPQVINRIHHLVSIYVHHVP